MTAKRWLVAGISLWLLTGMRDPFEPPEDRCRVAELAQWRYQGMVGQIGLIKDAQQKWRRVQQRDRLENVWTVSQLTPERLILALDDSCEPAQWQWMRQGEKNEVMGSNNRDVDNAHHAGGKAAKVNAGGG